jgi:hypothetical protein
LFSTGREGKASSVERARLGLAIMRWQTLDGSDEAVSSTSCGFNLWWSVRRVAKGLAQPFHGGVQSMIEVDECVPRPNLVVDSSRVTIWPGGFKRRLQHEERLFLQAYLNAAQLPGT